jgi:molybdate transport system ATP-binding protein
MAILDLSLTHPLRSFALELSLEVGRETVALVGPSGAGKSSVLRVVAGLLSPLRGAVRVGETTWFDSGTGVDLPPEERSVGLVFQEYALFPHLSVRRNVTFGAAREAEVDALLRRFRIDRLADERPGALSGGERQRVALARALARNPRVLLLDEPLSALDAHTRATVRGELRELLAELQLPTILVTHDFEDAATLADRVAVMSEGRILQLGTPGDLVSQPDDPFVATFTGANVLRGVAAPGRDGLTAVTLDTGGSMWSTDVASGPVALVVYPWEVSVSIGEPDDSALNHVRAPISSIVSLGNRARVKVGPLTAEVTSASGERLGLREGEVVVASFKATAARLLAA